MTATFVGGGNLTGSGSLTIPLPAESVEGDLLVVAAMQSSVSTFPAGVLTVHHDAAVGTGKAYLGSKSLTASDILAGKVVFVSDAHAAVGYVVYRSASVGVVGQPVNRSGTGVSITALAVPGLLVNQTAVVVRFEKSTGKTASPTVSPTTTERTSYWTSGSASPSIWIGDYAGPGVDRLFTDTVASGNGCGIQLSLVENGTSKGPSVSVYFGGSEITNCSVSIWNGTTEVPASSVEIIS